MAERFTVSYRILADSMPDAEQRAGAIALEQTVEIPRDLVPTGYIENLVLGQVTSVTASADQVYNAVLSYSMDAVGDSLNQLINVIYGNTSMQQGIKVVDFRPCARLTALFPGARFGIDGLRRLIGRERGGLVCPVLKPQGTNTGDLAKLCYATLRAGADIVKEDHGLANQPAAPFRDRVPALAQAAARANAKRADAGDTTRGLYFATMNGHGNQLHDDALFAKQAGADGVLIMPGLFGYDAINCLARDPEFGLPIMAHPSHLGAFASSADNGYSHGMLFGTLARLAGADISIFPNVSGRFGYSHAECREIAAACTDPSGHGIPILPSPGGGMTLDRMADMRSMYGDDCVYLLGGGLLRLGDRIGDGVREMIAALSA